MGYKGKPNRSLSAKTNLLVPLKLRPSTGRTSQGQVNTTLVSIDRGTNKMKRNTRELILVNLQGLLHVRKSKLPSRRAKQLQHQPHIKTKKWNSCLQSVRVIKVSKRKFCLNTHSHLISCFNYSKADKISMLEEAAAFGEMVPGPEYAITKLDTIKKRSMSIKID